VPNVAYRRIFDRLHTRLRHRLTAMAADPDDETRHQFDAWIAALPGSPGALAAAGRHLGSDRRLQDIPSAWSNPEPGQSPISS
jgi:hypothetical protein